MGSLEETVRIYRGDFLAGFHVQGAPGFEEWQLAQRARLRETMMIGLQTLAERLTDGNEVERAIRATRRLIELEPWREEAHRQLMALLARIFFDSTRGLVTLAVKENELRVEYLGGAGLREVES